MEITPRSFGDNFNLWFKTLGRNWKPLLLSSMAVHIPLALGLLAAFALTGATEGFERVFDPEVLESLTDDEVRAIVTDWMVVGGVWIVLQTVAAVFVYLASARTVAEDLVGETPTWAGVSRFAGSRLMTGLATVVILSVGFLAVIAVPVLLSWGLIAAAGANVVTVFAAAGLGLTLFVAVVWLGMSMTLAVPVVALENIGPAGAIKRSFMLVLGRWWPTLGFIMLTGLIVGAVGQVFSFIWFPLIFLGSFVPEAVAVAYVLIALSQGALAPAVGTTYALWYVDLRARKEPLATVNLLT